MKQVMYLGPAVPGLVKKNAVFKDGLPAMAAKRAETDKSFARLFVPVGKVFEAKKQLGTEGSLLAASYAYVENNIYSVLNAERGTDGQHI